MNDGTSELRDHYDPYHKLLGISQSEQPPTCYRILGIEEFEADIDVIDAAADRQMSYLHGCKNGAHANSAEQLLNEVSEARLRLIDPQAKTQYDRQLVASRQLRQKHSQAPVLSNTIDLNEPTEASVTEDTTPHPASPESDPAQAEPTPRIRVAKDHRKAKKSNSHFWTLGTICSCSLIFVVAWKLGMIDTRRVEKVASLLSDATAQSEPALSSPSMQPVATKEPLAIPSSRPSNRSIADPRPNRTTTDSPKSDEQTGIRSITIGPSGRGPTMVRSTVIPNDDSAPANAPKLPNGASTTTEAKRERLQEFREMAGEPTDTPMTVTPTSVAPKTEVPATEIHTGNPDTSINTVRLPIPSDEKIDDATVQMQMSLASKFKAAQSRYEKQVLGTELTRIATETKSPSQRYVLLQTAKDHFVKAGHVVGAMSAIDSLETQFIINGVQERLPAIIKLEPMLFRPLDQVALADHAEEAIASAVLEEDFEAAAQLCLLCKRLAGEMRNLAMQNKFTLKLKQNKAIQRAQSKVAAFRKVLSSEPDNAVANEFLGRFHCFAKSDWDNGLPLLARSENSDLRELAKLESGKPASTDAMELLADQWWKLAENSPRDASLERESRRRAAHWYQLALQSGLTGLSRAAAKTRIELVENDEGIEAIETIANRDMRVPVRPRGVPDTAIFFNGNWYEFSRTTRKFEDAVAMATKAGARLVVIRSQAENDFIFANSRRPLLLGMLRKDGKWYDALGEQQHFFLWDELNDQPDGGSIEPIAMMDYRGPLWHDTTDKMLYYAIEWGRE